MSLFETPFSPESNIVWDDLRVPGLSIRTSGGTPPDVIAPFAGNANLYFLSFDGVSQLEEVFFDIQFPHSWKEGSLIYPHVHFSPISTNVGDLNSRTVKFILEYTWVNLNEKFGIVSAYPMTKSFVPNTSQWMTMVASNPSGITDKTKKISSLMKCRLYRNPTDVEDTYPADVSLDSFDIHFQVDSNGSVQEYIK